LLTHRDESAIARKPDPQLAARELTPGNRSRESPFTLLAFT
jgi:hypothetical protein